MPDAPVEGSVAGRWLIRSRHDGCYEGSRRDRFSSDLCHAAAGSRRALSGYDFFRRLGGEPEDDRVSPEVVSACCSTTGSSVHAREALDEFVTAAYATAAITSGAYRDTR